MSPQSDTDIRIALATQKERLDGLSNTIEREFARMAEALGKHADMVASAVSEMKAGLVSNEKHNRLEDRIARIEKIVYTLCGTALLSVVVAVLANVGLGK